MQIRHITELLDTVKKNLIPKHFGNTQEKMCIRDSSGGGHEPKVLQVGKINSSQDGVIVDPKGISPTHTAGHGNTPKVLMIGNCNPSGNGMNGNVYSEKWIVSNFDHK